MKTLPTLVEVNVLLSNCGSAQAHICSSLLALMEPRTLGSLIHVVHSCDARVTNVTPLVRIEGACRWKIRPRPPDWIGVRAKCLWISEEQKSVQINIQNKADRNTDPEIKKDHIHLQLGRTPRLNLDRSSQFSDIGSWLDSFWKDFNTSLSWCKSWQPKDRAPVKMSKYLSVKTHTRQGQHFPLVVSMYYVVSSRKVKIIYCNIFLHQ